MSLDMDQLASDQQITLSAADLQRLLADVAGGGGLLPPGAYRVDGEVWRDVLEPTGRRRPIKDASGKPTGRFEAVNRRVRRRVLVIADASPAGVRAARRQAKLNGLDFYHPGRDPDSGAVLGWVRAGVKREVDVAQNLGIGGEPFEAVYTEIPFDPDAEGSTLAASPGIAVDADQAELDALLAEANADLPDLHPELGGDDPFSDDAVRAAAAASGRRGRS